MAAVDAAIRVLHYWRLVELVTASEIPDPQNGDHVRVSDLTTRTPLPWSPATEGADTTSNGVWRYTVFGGIFDLAKAHRALLDAFGDDDLPPEARRRVAGRRSALFSFALDENGELIEGSADLSMLAWVVAHAGARFRPRVLDDFDDERETFLEQLDRLADPDAPAPTGAEGPERPTLRDRATERIKDAAHDAVNTGASTIGAAAGAAAGGAVPVVGGILGPIVATFVERLLTLRRPERTNDAGPHPSAPATGTLLTVEALTGLVEALVEKLNLRETLSPLGVRVRATWTRADSEPTDQSWFLNSVYAPEMARVSKAVRSGDVGGALSAYVSVPDDEIRRRRLDVRRSTDAVVRTVDPSRAPLGRWPASESRALVLSQQFAVNTIREQLGDGVGVVGVNGPPGTGKTTLLRDLIADVVVERARRLAMLARPGQAFGPEEYRADFENGSHVPIRVLRTDLIGSEVILATTTNSAAANVTAEIPSLDAVDLSEHADLDHFTSIATEVLGAPAWGLIAATLGNRRNNRAFTRSFWKGPGRMKDTLAHAEGHPPTGADWRQAVSTFTTALAEVTRLVGERQRAAEALACLPVLRARIEQEQATVEATQQHARATDARWRVASARVEEARSEEENARLATDGHRRPTAFHWLWQGPTRWREGRRRHEELHGRWAAWQAEHGNRRAECARLQVALTELTNAVHRARTALDASVRRENLAQQSVDEARERWGPAVPLRAGSSEEQLWAPWADPELTRARTAVFVAAMAVHRAFVLGAATPIRRAVSVVVDFLNGTTVHIDERGRHAAWQAFFLLVPVVSTTFASLPRLFRGLGRESLGWLLVDEAGQATPQALVGGLWRARRAVVVGDPRQLEPVLPVPGTVMKALARRAEVTRAWTVVSSAQEVADRITPVGTVLRDESSHEGLWVGAPLRVHRRCDRPVFEVFSRMAYDDDLLIFGTTTERSILPGRNTWLHVPCEPGTDKWSEALGAAVTALLRELWRQQVTRETCILSPFRDVVTGVKSLEATNMTRDGPGLGEVGTVHTMQGKESDVVVLVLGTGADADGARSWATSRPNLFNVAVSRARRRLYVIGDVDRWGELPFARELLTAVTIDRGDRRPPST